jgi:hypothetical protein
VRLDELMEKNQPDGTYAGAYFTKATVDGVTKFGKENNIPNMISPSKLHCTILYSRKYLPEYKACGKYEKPLVGKPVEFDIWKTSPSDPKEDKTNCLVLKFECDDLVARHKDLMKEHGATFDYDEYRPHLTLSYNVGDLNIKDLPMYDGPIEIEEEYQEDLDLNWAKSKGTK